ncbi:MAG: phosphotransferase, partial [Acidobacteria bacterium]|nr:phosphotransferase [Acidobacteriota bacterium]
VTAVLDWEMATLGDPLMDLGTSLGYWVDPGDPPEIQALALSPTTLPGNPSRTEVVALYEEASGRSAGDIVFYYAYGLFKIAVIIQQIYARYKKGLTGDPRFADLIVGVRGCAVAAAQAVARGRIDDLWL